MGGGNKGIEGVKPFGDLVSGRRTRWVMPDLAKLRKHRPSFAMAAYSNYKQHVAQRLPEASEGEVAILLESGRRHKGSRLLRNMRLWMLSFRPIY